MKLRTLTVLPALALFMSLQTGCAVVAVADAAISVGATAVKIGAKTVGVAVDVLTPSSDDKKEEKK